MCVCVLLTEILLFFNSKKQRLIDILFTLFVSKSSNGKCYRRKRQGKINATIKVKVIKGTQSIGRTLFSQGAGKGVDFMRIIIRAAISDLSLPIRIDIVISPNHID